MISPQRRTELLDAIRRGTVPQRSLDLLAVGLDRFVAAFDQDLDLVAAGGAAFKAIRGEYGCGKTFCARWLQERAKKRGFASAEVQISEQETPLHRLETIYRRATERLSTIDRLGGAFRSVIDVWFHTLEEDLRAEGLDGDDPARAAEFERRLDALVEERLAVVSRRSPMFAQALRGYRAASREGDVAAADGIVAWLGGQPNVAAAAKRLAGVKGEIDHFGAGAFLQGLLAVLRDSGQRGLVLVLDEVETIQRVRGDVREKGLNALRQFLDDIAAGIYPGLYLVLTGTRAFFEGPLGIARLEPLAQRLHVDFSGDGRFDNPRAPQIRLSPFDMAKLEEVGRRLRDLFAEGSPHAERIRTRCDDRYIGEFARAVAGQLGERVGVAPRIYLRKLVLEILDRIDQFEDFDPRTHYRLTIARTELTPEERQAAGAGSVDEIELDLPDAGEAAR